MKYYVKSTGITLVGTITNISLFTAQLLCLLHVQVCIRKSSVKRTITALNHSVSQHDVHTTENDTSSKVFFGRHTTELQNMSVVRSLPELEYGGNCLELFVCGSQPVDTATSCAFDIRHPHGVVCAEMAGGGVSHPM